MDVGGPGVVSYRYRVDGGPLSATQSVTEPIVLQGLDPTLSHTLQVVAMNDAGEWFAAPVILANSRCRLPHRVARARAKLCRLSLADWIGKADRHDLEPEVVVQFTGIANSDLLLLKGVASSSPTVNAATNFDLSVAGSSVGVEILPDDFPTQDVSGTLAGDALWSRDIEYHVVGNLTIPRAVS